MLPSPATGDDRSIDWARVVEWCPVPTLLLAGSAGDGPVGRIIAANAAASVLLTGGGAGWGDERSILDLVGVDEAATVRRALTGLPVTYHEI